MKFADLILPLAVDALYTYRVPETLENVIQRGMLVNVPFAGNKVYTAVVYQLHSTPPEAIETKTILGIVDEQVILTSTQLKLMDWVSSYYMCSRGEVIKALLPTLFRLESFTSVVKHATPVSLNTLTENEKRVIDFLQLDTYQSVSEIVKSTGIKNIMPVIRTLVDKECIAVKENLNALYKGKQKVFVVTGPHYKDTPLDTLLETLKRSKIGQQVVMDLHHTDFTEMEQSEFRSSYRCTPTVLSNLIEKGILAKEIRIVDSFEEIPTSTQPFAPLSEIQQKAYDKINACFDAEKVVLLHGVTSSGKTEVYIHLIEQQLKAGNQVLFLLPEIALTIQIVKRLRKVFGNQIGVYHSGMTDKMRVDMWRKQRSDNPYPIIIGVRSSLFLPFAHLGLIIVDEEHETSYKQSEPAPRYNGRDVAIVLAGFHKAHIVLGSATPSFESYHNAMMGKYGYVTMKQRFNNIALPEILLANMAEFRRKKLLKGALSPLLIDKMKEVLGRGEQVMLFQNRRGYSAFLKCDTCGDVPRCPHCDVSMTYYKNRDILVCHYCGAIRTLDVSLCDHCKEGHYRYVNPGTEGIEEEVKHLFPDAVVARMDTEVMTSKQKSARLIEDFENKKIDILIGTQMIAKGLDFENVKLVGIIDADMMLRFPDFRAQERAFSLLTQVSGRSGRSGTRGSVVIQLSDVQDPVVGSVCKHAYKELFDVLCEERQLFHYPPFARIIQIEMRDKNNNRVRDFANKFAAILRSAYGQRVCGPAVPPIGKIQDMYRIQLLLKLENSAPFSSIKQFIKQQMNCLSKEPGNSSVRVHYDVDPY